jgi:hypothetical protein
MNSKDGIVTGESHVPDSSPGNTIPAYGQPRMQIKDLQHRNRGDQNNPKPDDYDFTVHKRVNLA